MLGMVVVVDDADVVVMQNRVVLGIEGVVKVVRTSQGRHPGQKREVDGIRAFEVAFVEQMRMLKMVLTALEVAELD